MCGRGRKALAHMIIWSRLLKQENAKSCVNTEYCCPKEGHDLVRIQYRQDQLPKAVSSPTTSLRYRHELGSGRAKEGYYGHFSNVDLKHS